MKKRQSKWNIASILVHLISNLLWSLFEIRNCNTCNKQMTIEYLLLHSTWRRSSSQLLSMPLSYLVLKYVIQQHMVSLKSDVPTYLIGHHLLIEINTSGQPKSFNNTDKFRYNHNTVCCSSISKRMWFKYFLHKYKRKLYTSASQLWKLYTFSSRKM